MRWAVAVERRPGFSVTTHHAPVKIAARRTRPARHPVEQLLGKSLPSTPLDSSSGPVNLAQLATGSLVLLFLGDEMSGQSASADTSQCRSYREASLQFAALNVKIAAVCSLAPERTRLLARREGLPFPLISDPDLRLAWMLGLPTMRPAHEGCYRRLTLIAHQARVASVLYPVRVQHDAGQVMRWMLDSAERREHRASACHTPPGG